MKFEKLRKSLQEAPIIKIGDYDYVIHPITDGIPMIESGLLREITTELKKLVKQCGWVDRIVTMDAMGIPLATALSLELDIPFTIIRKKEYKLPGEVAVEQVTGYSKAKMFVNGLRKGDHIVIVDDVLSTGGTLRAVLSVLKKIGVVVEGVFIVIYKGKCIESIMKESNVVIKALITIDVRDGHVVFLS